MVYLYFYLTFGKREGPGEGMGIGGRGGHLFISLRQVDFKTENVIFPLCRPDLLVIFKRMRDSRVLRGL